MGVRGVAVVAAVVLAVAGCSGGDGGEAKAPAGADSTVAVDREVQPTERVDARLGEPVETLGSESPAQGDDGGVLELTPSSVVYGEVAQGYDPVNGLFVTVAYRARSTKAVAASEVAPIEGGGWGWVAPDGQAVGVLEGEATSLTPDGFSGAGPVQAGTFEWRSVSFDIGPGQRGGALMYVDGGGEVFRWRVPERDTGPEAIRLRAALE